MILIDARALQTYSFYRGIGGYVKRLVDIYDNNNDFSFLLFSKIKQPDFEVKNKLFINSYHKMISFTDSVFLKNFLKNIDIKVYHSTAFGLPKRVSGVNYISTIHDLTQLKFKEFSGFRNRLIQKRFIKSNVKNSDIIIAVSENTKRDLIEYFNVDEKRISVVHQYINFKDIDNRFCKKYFLPSNYLFYAGGFDKIKNVESIIKVLPLVKTPLILAGYIDEKTKNYLVNLIDYKYRKYIIFKGFVRKEELICLYKNAGVFVFPSLYEGFGYPPIEALFFKTPVITSDKGSLKEVLKDYSVYLEDPYDTEELYSKIRYVFDSYDLIKESFETEKFKNFIDYYSKERFENQMNYIYNELK